jgi:5-(carboxyamino)imidazole ribonucleotide mutase
METVMAKSKKAIDVGIIMGSKSDWPTMEPAAKVLDDFGIGYEVEVVSAHRTPDKMICPVWSHPRPPSPCSACP